MIKVSGKHLAVEYTRLEPHLSDDVCDEFVESKGDVGINTKHFTKFILVDSWLYITIQQIFNKGQKVCVIVFHWHRICGYKTVKCLNFVTFCVLMFQTFHNFYNQVDQSHTIGS